MTSLISTSGTALPEHGRSGGLSLPATNEDARASTGTAPNVPPAGTTERETR